MDIDTIYSDQEDIIATSEDEVEVEEAPPTKKVAKKKAAAAAAATATNKLEKKESESLFDTLLKDLPSKDTNSSSSWDFRGAIASIKEEHKSDRVQSSVDDKIRRVVERRKHQQLEAEKDESSSSNDDDSENDDDEEGEEKQVVRRLKTESAPPPTTTSAPHVPRATSFSSLQLSRPLLRAAQQLNYASPTPIQAEAIPLILQGKDVLASAVTGSGKTAAYLFPVIERLLLRDRRTGPVTRVLALVPTRELAQQISSMLDKLCGFCPDGAISQAVLLGGVATLPQAALIRSRPDILIATPGRLIDHLRNTHGFDIADLEILILDEADRLLELGFTDSLKEILKFAPAHRQTLLFSATISSDVSKLAELSLHAPYKIQTDPLYDVAQRLVQEFVRVRKMASVVDPEEQIRRREAILCALCRRTVTTKVIVFFTHKRQAHRTCVAFGLLGFKCAELHGNLTQQQRLEALERFRSNQVDFLFCTDLAARGIDIPGVACVINFDLPKDLTTYIHRVGRTARAGKGGRSISLVGEDRRSTMKELLKSSSSSTFQSRTVGSKILVQCYDQLLAVSDELEQIVRMEKVEREIRLAEVDAQKAENMLVHKEEIFSRPKKTWFQSQQEKDELKQQSKDLYDGKEENEEEEEEEEEVEDKKEKRERVGNRAKRRRVAAREREERERRRIGREEGVEPISNEFKQKMGAKAQKRKLQGNEPPPQPTGKRAKKIDDARDLTKMVPRKVRKLRGTADEDKGNFVEKRSRAFKEEKFKVKNTPLRKGGKQGQHKFKSKQKFKRRK